MNYQHKIERLREVLNDAVERGDYYLEFDTRELIGQLQQQEREEEYAMTRTEYLAARADWKNRYAELTARIRAAKAARKETQRELARRPYYANWLRNIPEGWTDQQVREANKLNNGAYKDMMATWRVALLLKAEATKLLDENVELKKDAQRAYEAAREAV